MNIGILGSGDVGKTLAQGFLKSGNNVKIASRDPSKLDEWLKHSRENISIGSFSDTANFGELLVLCCKGTAYEDVINLAGKENFTNKVLIDVTNPIEFKEEGKAPTLTISYPNSQSKIIQELLPESKVVKSFNTVTAKYMCNPKLEDGIPDMFVAGNDVAAKQQVSKIAQDWGWKVIDIGNINQAYLLEALAMLWIQYGFKYNHWSHSFKMLMK